MLIYQHPMEKYEKIALVVKIIGVILLGPVWTDSDQAGDTKHFSLHWSKRINPEGLISDSPLLIQSNSELETQRSQGKDAKSKMPVLLCE